MSKPHVEHPKFMLAVFSQKTWYDAQNMLHFGAHYTEEKCLAQAQRASRNSHVSEIFDDFVHSSCNSYD